MTVSSEVSDTVRAGADYRHPGDTDGALASHNETLRLVFAAYESAASGAVVLIPKRG